MLAYFLEKALCFGVLTFSLVSISVAQERPFFVADNLPIAVGFPKIVHKFCFSGLWATDEKTSKALSVGNVIDFSLPSAAFPPSQASATEVSDRKITDVVDSTPQVEADADSTTKIYNQNNNIDDSGSPILEPGLWIIEKNILLYEQNALISRSIDGKTFCYTNDMIDIQKEKGFVWEWGTEWLPGYECKDEGGAIQRGMAISRKASCHAIDGGEKLTLQYMVWLGGHWMKGELEVRSGAMLFRLEVSGRRVDECIVESFYDYQ